MTYIVCVFNNKNKKSEIRFETKDYNEAIYIKDKLKNNGEISFIDYSNE